MKTLILLLKSRIFYVFPLVYWPVFLGLCMVNSYPILQIDVRILVTPVLSYWLCLWSGYEVCKAERLKNAV
jgi:hypothetical protein